jgi:hypothetical protein
LSAEIDRSLQFDYISQYEGQGFVSPAMPGWSRGTTPQHTIPYVPD